ncbi:hypothetical protein K1X12_13630 [Hyphomonas sp. WL0036]|uniref:DUF4350 domain-containing protein n=1 Tax=Hyphomonas sediminis TaxID=2866160 RepID=UPI001C81AB8A|nr:DUF4350 domain-containing protein [Hyphomonas sediminis]MBY9067946.1 hypothetical protein [Hyphomonas sediminis]
MSKPAQGDSPFSVRIVAILIAIALIAFGGVMVLAGWAPELRERNVAGDHPYSTSALGYNGFVRLLTQQGIPVSISRLERDLEQRDWGVMIVTAPAFGNFREMSELDFQSSTLLVLPKWIGHSDPLNSQHQADTYFIEARHLNNWVHEFYPDAEIVRAPPGTPVKGAIKTGALKPDVRLQLIKSESLDTIVGTDTEALVAYDPTRGIYVLSDPDMINTFGLANRENALFATRLVNYLRTSELEPVLLDATIHGFTRSENLLKMLFSAPYIGATLIALAAALLLGWAATVRFGPPARDIRAIALGKQALADNSAGLISMARREIRMAPGYAAMIRRRLALALRLPRHLTEKQLTEVFDRLDGSDEEPRFSELEAAIRGQTSSREDLVQKARELHQRRKEIIRRVMHERG